MKAEGGSLEKKGPLFLFLKGPAFSRSKALHTNTDILRARHLSFATFVRRGRQPRV